jgi:hypothetical protein
LVLGSSVRQITSQGSENRRHRSCPVCLRVGGALSSDHDEPPFEFAPELILEVPVWEG